MKKSIILLSAVACLASATYAQRVSTFDDLVLPADSFYNGQDQKGAFKSGDAHFECKYDTAFGGYWAAGFALSNKKDSTSAGFLNQYSAITATGLNSANYVIGQQNAVIKIDSAVRSLPLKGVFITNSTYAALSMKNGDSFAKKFGGSTGNDPDFFLLTIRKLGTLASPVVTFYLADYRSIDNNQDYIVKDWTFVDLSSLGAADSLQFTLTSSDIGAFGMNTPAYFALDNFNSAATASVRNRATFAAQVWPNPATNVVNVVLPVAQAQAIIRDITGKEVLSTIITQGANTLDIAALPTGVYVLSLQTADALFTQKLIKQ